MVSSNVPTRLWPQECAVSQMIEFGFANRILFWVLPEKSKTARLGRGAWAIFYFGSIHRHVSWYFLLEITVLIQDKLFHK